MLRIREGLRERGHDAMLFASSAAANGEADYYCRGTTGPTRALLQCANPWAWRRMRQLIGEFRPDVVHVRMFLTQLSPLILPPLGRVPSLYHVPWYRPVCPTGTKLLPDGTDCTVIPGVPCHRNGCVPLRWWLPLMGQRYLLRRWIHNLDRIVAVGQPVRSELLADGIGPVELLQNGTCVSAPRPPLHSPPSAAFAGRLVPEKGVDVLLRAFRGVVEELPEASLLIAGRGPELSRLKGLAERLGLTQQVKFAGHLARPGLEAELVHAWVQVVPSRWREPFGNVVAEAMMRGTVVVASAEGGNASLLEHGRTGLLVARNDVGALRDALVRLLTNRNVAEEMGQRARMYALEHLSESAYLTRLLAIYAELVSAGSNGGEASEI